MMMSSNGHIFRATGLLWGESSGHRWIPLTKVGEAERLDVFFALCLNKRLSKKSRRWWIRTPSRSLWGHCNVDICFIRCIFVLNIYHSFTIITNNDKIHYVDVAICSQNILLLLLTILEYKYHHYFNLVTYPVHKMASPSSEGPLEGHCWKVHPPLDASDGYQGNNTT